VLIDRYTNIIRGLFAGHSHEDTFQLMKGIYDTKTTGITFVHPALTTYRMSNPSFRVYEVDPKTYALIDYIQYRLYIDKADKEDKAVWEVVYRFSESHGVETLDYKHFPGIIEKIGKDRKKFENFTKMMYSEGPRGLKLFNAPNSQEFIRCRLYSSDIYEYQKCIGFMFVNIEYFFGYAIYSRFFNLPWSYVLEP